MAKWVIAVLLSIACGMTLQGVPVDHGVFPIKAEVLSGPPPRQDYFPVKAGLQKYYFWFPKPMKKAGEPSLWRLAQADSSKEVYRVIIFPPFSSVVLFRLEVQANGTGELVLTEVDQVLEDDDATGPVRRKARYLLTAAGVRHFKELLGKFDFWHQPTEIKETVIEDGTELVFECAREGKYHVTVRNATLHGAASNLAAYLLDLTHTSVEDY